MVIDPRERRIARSMYSVAVGMVESRDPSARDEARAALERPSAHNIFMLLAAGRGKPWLQSVKDALLQCGIAAAGDIMGDGS